jgi:hypothetical protein
MLSVPRWRLPAQSTCAPDDKLIIVYQIIRYSFIRLLEANKQLLTLV